MTGVPFLLEGECLSVVRGGVAVLDVPSLTLREGEVLSLIGPNGAGKSTLLLAVARLLPLAGGSIRYRGVPVHSDRDDFAYRRRLAMVFQEPLLFDATVFDNVAAGLKLRGMGKQDVRERVMETLELFRMAHLATRSATKLSGGEAQRTSLARAFAIRPELILLDEPFTALDPPTRKSLTADLERILRETRTAAIIATHDQQEALCVSDRMAVMSGGRIIQTGPPTEVMTFPVDEFVASFVGMENILAGTVESCRDGMIFLSLAGRTIEFPGAALPGARMVFSVSPEHVTVATADPGRGSSARNQFIAQITGIAAMGLYHKVQLDCGFPLVAHLTRQSVADLQLSGGMEVYVSFKATAVHLIRQDNPLEGRGETPV